MANEFNGFHRVAQASLFAERQSTVEALLQCVLASRNTPVGAEALPIAQRRRLTPTDIVWSRQNGGSRDAVNCCHWEVTLPALQISDEALHALTEHAKVSLQPVALPNGAGHFQQVQELADVLARCALPQLQRLHDRPESTLYHLATQITDGSLSAARGNHVDPAPIAAALATFSLEGTAQIVLTRAQPPRAEHAFECNTNMVYLLAATAVRRDMHRVHVTSERRLSVTLRFAARTDATMGRTPMSRAERQTARAHARTAQLTHSTLSNRRSTQAQS